MGSQIQVLNPQLTCKLPQRNGKKPIFSPFLLVHTNPRKNRTNLIRCNINLDQKQSVVPKTESLCRVEFETLGACKLGISRYPDFEYNAEGGRGTGTAKKGNETDDFLVDFNVENLYIPPLTSATTKFLGLPLPPLLRIDIVPEFFNGVIDQESGKVDLKFSAKFCFSIGKIYVAPPLLVETVLTSEESEGKIRRGKGERLSKEGRCRLVGVASVDPIDDLFMNTFLSLPTECLANMNAVILFSTT